MWPDPESNMWEALYVFGLVDAGRRSFLEIEFRMEKSDGELDRVIPLKITEYVPHETC